MARNGSGVYSLTAADNPVTANTLIEATKFNNTMTDIATALTNSLAANGETTVTGNIPMATYKITGLGAGTARTDAASLATIQDGTGVYVATVGGTADVITLTASPAITAYTAGQLFSWIASGANTTNVTVNVNAVGAKAVTKNGSTALIAGDIPSGALVSARYDGTRFQLASIGAATGLATSGGTMTGDIAMSGASIIETEGAVVASATTTEIWATDGNTRHITGTTTITSLGTAPQAGRWQKIIFDGALTLTHGANLNLPGSANITTAADDFAFVYADTTTQHDVLYFKKDGTAVAASSAASETVSGIVELATSAEIMTGTDTGRAMSPQRLRDAIGFSAYFQSSQQTITAAGSLTIAHGLGRSPVMYAGFLICTTGEGGYSTNDETGIYLGSDGDGARFSMLSLVPDATNINVRFGSSLPTIANKSNGALFNITAANWKLVVRAWA